MSTLRQAREFTYYKDLPSALKSKEELKALITSKKPAIFLDYDGTLTPIVEDAAKATLAEETRKIIDELSKLCCVGVISGRDRKDVEKMVGLDLVYAGSHGYDIAGPGGMSMQNEGGVKVLPSLAGAEEELKKRLNGIRGSEVERKRYAICVHYRHVQADKQKDVLKICDSVFEQYPDLKKGPGKMIMEFKPNIDWHKGKALLWLLDNLDLNKEGVLPFYLGDDNTDEDAFESLNGKGIGIIVGDHGNPTYASYSLTNCEEVREVLELFLRVLK